MRLKKRRICFVTGTRAEFGLMQRTLRAIQNHPKLQLQIIATGMHLSEAHGRSIDAIESAGFNVDRVVGWETGRDPRELAVGSAKAASGIARALNDLKSDGILVVGDRVEAFMAAGVGHVSQRMVAHVHGGDRAVGQIDDSLRHAITKLSHLHFPATRESAGRIARLGEDRSRIVLAGSPGLDEIEKDAMSSAEILRQFPKLRQREFALIVHHPIENNRIEFDRAIDLLRAVKRAGVSQCVVIFPNNDPGHSHIIRAWKKLRGEIDYLLPDVARDVFLGLLRDSAMLVGNSSSGIIEAASFGTRVINVGPRQQGRERSSNIVDVSYRRAEIFKAVSRIWNRGKPRRFTGRNVYGGNGTAEIIAHALANFDMNPAGLRKLITY